MSVHKEIKKVTTHILQEMKNRGEKISMLTAYDYSMAKIIDKAGIDVAKQPQIEITLKKQLKQVSFVKGFAMPHKRYKVKKNRLQMIKQSWA